MRSARSPRTPRLIREPAFSRVPNESFWLEALLRLLANNLLSLFIFDLRLFLPIDARVLYDSPDVFQPDLTSAKAAGSLHVPGPYEVQEDRKFKATEICVPACDIGAVRLVRRIRCPTKHFSFCGVNRRVSSLGPEKLHARERGGSVVFSSLHEVSVSSRNCSQLSRVRRRVGTGDGRMDPRARLRITGAVHRRGRVRGWRGLARVAVPTRGACEPVTAIRPVRCRPNCSADDAFFAGQTVVVGSMRVRGARGIRVHTVHAAHERLWQGVRGVRRLLHRAIVPMG